jgi:hypothetical protein
MTDVNGDRDLVPPGWRPVHPEPEMAAGWDRAADLWKAPAEIPDAATVDVPDELRAQIEDYMSRYPDYHSAAIPALMAAQKFHGRSPPSCR